MKLTASKFIAWSFSIFAVLLGLIFLVWSFIGGLLTIITGIFVAPKIRNKIKQKYDIEFTKWLVVLLGTIGFILGVGFTPIPVGDTSPSNNATDINNTPEETNTQSIEQRAENISWEALMRNESQHQGKAVYFKGEVAQVLEGSEGNYAIRVYTSRGSFDEYSEDTIWVEYQGSRVLDGDVIELWGEFVELHTYESVDGDPVTIPGINAEKLEVIE